MEFVTAIVIGIGGKIVDYTVGPLGRKVGYVTHYKSNLNNLRAQLKDLCAARERMQHRIDEDVKNWLTRVDDITAEVNSFLEDGLQQKSKCLHGSCPNPIRRYQLSRNSAKLVQRIVLRIQEKGEFPGASHCNLPEDVCGIPSRDYIAFESRISIVREILEELRNPDTNLIGVYGIGGVGKTTLAKEVYRQAAARKLFDDVAIVLDVKQIPDLEGIQKQILEKLGMEVVDGQSMAKRANHLWDRIRDKKILVILDDISEKIDLEAVGLLCVGTCYVLLTARNHGVLCSEMRTQKDYRLDVLRETESWKLFEMVAGNAVKEEPIRKVATQVAKKCAGLPLLVTAVASALRSSTIAEWKDALRRLKMLNVKESVEDVLVTLEWSYYQLDDEELKPLFLLCGIFACLDNSIDLDDCFKYCMGLGLLKNVHTMEDAQNAFHSLIRKLQSYCLLQEQLDDNNATVRMHELVRNVAIRIARRVHHVLLRSNDEELKEWPEKDFLEKCTMIFLPFSTIPSFPEVPWQCPELKMLQFGGVGNRIEIPGNFFEDMKGLKVLDLTRVRLPTLPPSLIFLTELQMLCLDQCVLGDIALVGQLRHLEILSFFKSKIKQLPKEIGQLARLRLLDLSDCSELVLISPNVIGSLKSLEDLRIGRNSFRQWEAEGLLISETKTNANLLELKQLSKLSSLEIHIPDPNSLPSQLFGELERFHIFIGEAWEWLDFDNSFNTLKLKLSTSKQLNKGLGMLVKRSEHLYLDVIEGVDNVFHLFDNDDFQRLKHLHVQNNTEIAYLINYKPFQLLQSVSLLNLPNLVSLSPKTTTLDDQLKIDGDSKENMPVRLLKNEERVMPNLTSLIVHQCNGLRFLLSSSMARSLAQLKHLEVHSCQIMEEVVSLSTKEIGEESADNILCNLHHLQLQHLPQLTRFYSGKYIEFPSLEILHLIDCTKMGNFILDSPIISDNVTICKDIEEKDLKDTIETPGINYLFDEKVKFPRLERLIICNLPKLMTIWHNQLAPGSFERLKKVDIGRCCNLINIFAVSLMEKLNVLDTLEVQQCKSLQVVFEVGGITVGADDISTFQSRKLGYCQNLELVKIYSCERLKNIFPASVAKVLQKLRKLNVKNCGVGEIVAEDLKGREMTAPKFVFPEVISLKFEDLPHLKSFYPRLHASRWPLLKNLKLLNCDSVDNFASAFSKFQNNYELGGLGTMITQPLFLIEGSFSNLERLTLNSEVRAMKDWWSLLPAELFSKLRSLMSQSLVFRSGFLQKLPNLEGLGLYGSEKELFGHEGSSSGDIEADGSVLPHLKYLALVKMPELMHLGTNNSPRPVIPNLEILAVSCCGKLKNLRSSAISFQNLTTLEVTECHGLEYLTTYSIARSLKQLTHMEVKDCQGLIQILANTNEDDDAGYEIAFDRLQHLELSGLSSLQRFCSSNYIVKLPSLDSLNVTGCQIELQMSSDMVILSNSPSE